MQNIQDNESRTKEKKKNHILLLLSCLAKARNLHSTHPFDLSISLLIYSVTGSKYILDLLNQFGVGVCYQTCRNQIGSLSSKLPPNLHKLVGSDAVVWFDNIQRHTNGSRSGITVGGPHTSIVTNIVAFLPSTHVQHIPSLAPSNWNQQTVSVQSFFPTSTDYDILNKFLSSLLSPMFDVEKTSSIQYVDTFVVATASDQLNLSSKECHKCGVRWQNSFRICKTCNVKLPTVADMKERAKQKQAILQKMKRQTSQKPQVIIHCFVNGKMTKQVKEFSLLGTPKIFEEVSEKVDPTCAISSVNLDPLDLNPASKENVKKIIQQILDDIPLDQQWSFLPICADGIPLRMLLKLQKEEPFKNILSILGLGHEEVNMLRAFNSLIWPLWGKSFFSKLKDF